MLYDDEFVKELPKVKPFPAENPWLVGICNFESNKELRILIEEWYTNVPDENKGKFTRRLRSINDEQFTAAFYELAVHQYCFEEKWAIEYEPKLESGLTPDFIITTKDGYKFILEVATMLDSKELSSIQIQKDLLTDAVNKIDSPFNIEVEFRINPDGREKPKELAKLVRQHLEKLDTSDPDKVHEFGIGYHSLSFMVRASLKYPKPVKGIIWSVSDGARKLPDYSERVKDTLNKKAKKYSSKKTELPLVIVLGDGVQRIRLSESTIDKTLFGNLTITFGGDEPTVWKRDKSGHFAPRNESDGGWLGKNTGISAVMFLSLKEKSSFQAQVFHQPFPHIPLSETVFSKMPQLLKSEFENGFHMRWVISNPEDLRITFYSENEFEDLK